MRKSVSIAAICAVLSAAPAALAQVQTPEQKDERGAGAVGLEQRPGLGGQQADLEVPPLGQQPGIRDQLQPRTQHEWQRPGPAGDQQVLFRAKELIGRQVQTTEGEDLGKLTEIVFHPEGGTFAILEIERDRLAPLPWTMVQRLTGRNIVVSGTSKLLLRGAPMITDDQWAMFNDPTFTQRIYTYHGLQPQEAMGGPGASQQHSLEHLPRDQGGR
jgi:sporulation protein YlmC with PRC-barrel domain